MWGRSLKITNCKLTWDLSPNMLHNSDGPTRWRTGQMGTREGWPNFWFNQTNSNLPQFPLLTLQTMVCANTLLLLPKFLSLNEFILITKNKLNKPCLSHFALLALPWINLHTLYSLHPFYFLWTIIFIGTPCSLSDWIMWYDWMNGTMLFLAKYLKFVFKKIINSLSPQNNENSYQSQS